MAPFSITCSSESGEVYKLDSGVFETLLKKDHNTMKAFKDNYKEKKNLLQVKRANMHMNLKFGSKTD